MVNLNPIRPLTKIGYFFGITKVFLRVRTGLIGFVYNLLLWTLAHICSKICFGYCIFILVSLISCWTNDVLFTRVFWLPLALNLFFCCLYWIARFTYSLQWGQQQNEEFKDTRNLQRFHPSMEDNTLQYHLSSGRIDYQWLFE